ncbi:FAD binding domain-containing protein [Ascobolus immersus RN42]|uniref:FAD binding domain-containing protein n=1 Tax=Ascobolus immersus RN42 TaxID=1160509 RepID=A0A3N4HZW9_ASCIM|nr:FAD binding domain-containing protein [Ascobolus immersus RN42]
MLPLLSLLTSLLASSVSAQTTQCKAHPTDAGSWPTTQQWAQLNQTVSGRLAAVIPPAAACHNSFNGQPTYNQARCTQIRNSWGQQDFHFNDPVSIMWDYWSNNTCAPSQFPGSCNIGTYPVYVVKAQSVADVQAGVNFARERGVRLVIKNTGHDFMGKSTGAASLSIWTHLFKEIQIINNYNDPSTTYTGPAIRLGSGWQAGDIFKELDRIGRTIVAGECAGVGVTGGYIQGGGHGPLSSLYGMGSDSVLQYTLVTASGTYITADASQNTDIFWALRGGGGASFGVVISVTLKTYPSPRTSAMTLSFSSQQVGGNDRFWSAIGAFHAAGPTWVENGLFGYYEINPGQFTLQPLLAPNKTQAELQRLTEPFLQNLRNQGINLTPRYHEHSNFLASYNALFAGEGSGVSMLTSSRLILKSHIRNNNAAVTNAFRRTVEGGRFIVGHMVGPPPYADSAVNPIWREGVLLPLYNAFVQAGASEQEKQRIIQETNNVYDKVFKDATPGGGGYVNEGNIFDPNWKQEFYGAAYARLYRVKREVDPQGVFWAKTAVGSELWEERVGGRLCRTNIQP